MSLSRKHGKTKIFHGGVQTRDRNPTSPLRSILLRAGRPDFRWALDLPRRLSIRRSILPARRPTAAARVAIRPTPQKNSSTSNWELPKSAKDSVDKSKSKVTKSSQGGESIIRLTGHSHKLVEKWACRNTVALLRATPTYCFLSDVSSVYVMFSDFLFSWRF